MKLRRADKNICKDVNYVHDSVKKAVESSPSYKLGASFLNALGYTTRTGEQWTERALLQWNCYHYEKQHINNKKRGIAKGRTYYTKHEMTDITVYKKV